MSLLPLVGMFLFGGKKKEEKKKIEYPPGITEELLRTINNIVFYHGTGLYKILARATPEQDVEHVKEILDHDEGIGPRVTEDAGYKKKYVDEVRDPTHSAMIAHYPLLHTILTIAMAYHTGTHNREAAKPIEKVLNASYTLKEDYSTIKKNYRELADAIAHHAKEQGLTTDEDKTAKVMEQALEKAFKIVDKLLPELPELTEDRAKIAEKALKYSTDDPFVVLRNAGIDIEPELEEFRQFLAEISGKKIEPQKPAPPLMGKGAETPTDLNKVKLEVLSILQALEFAGYSEEAKRKAVEKLSGRIRELSESDPTPEVIFEMGLYAYAVEVIRASRYEKTEKLKEL